MTDSLEKVRVPENDPELEELRLRTEEASKWYIEGMRKGYRPVTGSPVVEAGNGLVTQMVFGRPVLKTGDTLLFPRTSCLTPELLPSGNIRLVETECTAMESL